MQGLAEVIAAEGQYNQATAAAAVDLTRAQSDALKNQVQSVQTTWAMWNIGREQIQRELVHMPRRKNSTCVPGQRPPALWERPRSIRFTAP